MEGVEVFVLYNKDKAFKLFVPAKLSSLKSLRECVSAAVQNTNITLRCSARFDSGPFVRINSDNLLKTAMAKRFPIKVLASGNTNEDQGKQNAASKENSKLVSPLNKLIKPTEGKKGEKTTVKNDASKKDVAEKEERVFIKPQSEAPTLEDIKELENEDYMLPKSDVMRDILEDQQVKEDSSNYNPFMRDLKRKSPLDEEGERKKRRESSFVGRKSPVSPFTNHLPYEEELIKSAPPKIVEKQQERKVFIFISDGYLQQRISLMPTYTINIELSLNKFSLLIRDSQGGFDLRLNLSPNAKIEYVDENNNSLGMNVPFHI